MKKQLRSNSASLRQRHQNLFTELEAYLNAYLALLKKASRPQK